jgi:hypothetical protein
MTELRSLPLDDRSALATARGTDYRQREDTLRSFAGTIFFIFSKGNGCSIGGVFNLFNIANV